MSTHRRRRRESMDRSTKQRQPGGDRTHEYSSIDFCVHVTPCVSAPTPIVCVSLRGARCGAGAVEAELPGVLRVAVSGVAMPAIGRTVEDRSSCDPLQENSDADRSLPAHCMKNNMASQT